jgi:hypothetical protein
MEMWSVVVLPCRDEVSDVPHAFRTVTTYLALDQNGEVLRILAIPRRKGLEKLEAVRGRRDSDGDR